MTQVGVKEAFIDGGFGWNNPAKKLCNEARARFPNQKIDCIISIGSGTNPGNSLPEPKWWQKRIAVHVIPTLITITTECRKTHNDMSSTFRDHPNTYFRFDVEGLGQIGLEEWKLIPVIKTKTLGYLEGDEINTRVNTAVNALYASQRKRETTPNSKFNLPRILKTINTNKGAETARRDDVRGAEPPVPRNGGTTTACMSIIFIFFLQFSCL